MKDNSGLVWSLQYALGATWFRLCPHFHSNIRQTATGPPQMPRFLHFHLFGNFPYLFLHFRFHSHCPAGPLMGTFQKLYLCIQVVFLHGCIFVFLAGCILAACPSGQHYCLKRPALKCGIIFPQNIGTRLFISQRLPQQIWQLGQKHNMKISRRESMNIEKQKILSSI